MESVADKTPAITLTERAAIIAAGRLASAARKRLGGTDHAALAILAAAGIDRSRAAYAQVALSDAQRYLRRASEYLTSCRPYRPEEALTEAQAERRHAESLREAADELRGAVPHPVHEVQHDSRDSRVAAHRDYTSGGWRGHYRALAETRREASIASQQALKHEIGARLEKHRCGLYLYSARGHRLRSLLRRGDSASAAHTRRRACPCADRRCARIERASATHRCEPERRAADRC